MFLSADFKGKVHLRTFFANVGSAFPFQAWGLARIRPVEVEHFVENDLLAVCVTDQLGLDPVYQVGQVLSPEGLIQRVVI